MAGWKPLLVGLGGVAGAGLRWAVVDVVGPQAFPWALLVVNIGGSAVLGALGLRQAIRTRGFVRLGLAVGFCGGLTTYSGFAVTIADLGRDGRISDAALFAAASVVLSVAAFVAAERSTARLRPRTTP